MKAAKAYKNGISLDILYFEHSNRLHAIINVFFILFAGKCDAVGKFYIS